MIYQIINAGSIPELKKITAGTEYEGILFGHPEPHEKLSELQAQAKDYYNTVYRSEDLTEETQITLHTPFGDKKVSMRSFISLLKKMGVDTDSSGDVERANLKPAEKAMQGHFNSLPKIE